MPACTPLIAIRCGCPRCAHANPVLALTTGVRLYMPGAVLVEIAMQTVDLRCPCGWRKVWRRGAVQATVEAAEQVAA